MLHKHLNRQPESKSPLFYATKCPQLSILPSFIPQIPLMFICLVLSANDHLKVMICSRGCPGHQGRWLTLSRIMPTGQCLLALFPSLEAASKTGVSSALMEFSEATEQLLRTAPAVTLEANTSHMPHLSAPAWLTLCQESTSPGFLQWLRPLYSYLSSNIFLERPLLMTLSKLVPSSPSLSSLSHVFYSLYNT